MKKIISDYFNILKTNSFDKEMYFYKYPRLDEYQPYSVHIKYQYDEKRVYNAWGNGLSQDEAFGKSFMELIERYIFLSFTPFNYQSVYGILKKRLSLFDIANTYRIDIKYLHPANSNGVAIHSSLQKAIQSALYELLERHCILYAILDKISPSKKVQLKVTKEIQCDFYIWDGPLKSYVVVGALKKENGWYFSSSCSFSFKDAINRAKLEINSFISLNDSFKDGIDFKISKDDIDSFNRYHRYSGDERIIEFLNSNLRGKIPDLKKKDFFYTKIPQPKLFHGLFDFPCVRVINPFVQQLFFDNWEISYLNPLLFDKNIVLPEFPHIIA